MLQEGELELKQGTEVDVVRVHGHTLVTHYTNQIGYEKKSLYIA